MSAFVFDNVPDFLCAKEAWRDRIAADDKNISTAALRLALALEIRFFTASEASAPDAATLARLLRHKERHIRFRIAKLKAGGYVSETPDGRYLPVFDEKRSSPM
jgi:hypothetical protein